MAEELRTRYLLAVAFALTSENASLGSIVGKKIRKNSSKAVSKRFCEKCGVLAIPGETADFRVTKGKISRDCLCCSRFR